MRPPKEASRAFAAEVGWTERMRLLSPFAFTEEVDAGLLERFIEKKSGDVQSEEGYRAQIAAVLAHDASERLRRHRTRDARRDGRLRPRHPCRQ